MKPGDLLRMKAWRTYGQDGRSWFEFKAPQKDVVMVAFVVGFEPLKEGSRLDVGAALNQLGWVPEPAEASDLHTKLAGLLCEYRGRDERAWGRLIQELEGLLTV